MQDLVNETTDLATALSEAREASDSSWRHYCDQCEANGETPTTAGFNAARAYKGPAKVREPLSPEKIEAMAQAARDQAAYERKRALQMDEAVLVATLLRQRIPGIEPIGAVDLYAASSRIYAALLACGRTA